MHKKSAIVVGAGIVGLALARSLSEKGYVVTVFERSAKAVGASVRNFGMVWPVGQPDGHLYERALRSRAIWKEVCEGAGLWLEEAGSLHLAYDALELQVMEEFAAAGKGVRPVELLSAAATTALSPAVNGNGLKAGLWSRDEVIIESRVAIEKLPGYLQERYGVQFYFGIAVTVVQANMVVAGGKTWQADEIFIASGADFETLYPEIFTANHFTKCKLQMMRLAAQPDQWRIGPSLCGSLSMVHYKSFASAPSLNLLKKHYEQTMPEYLQWGIHVMVSQNGTSELTIGDSHEYGDVHDPFDKQHINDLILAYLRQFAQFKNWELLQSWHGIYAKRTNGETDFVYEAEPGITIVNGMGGNGMTLSFGLAEEVVRHK
ncbi:FAD dependent oxidoreductase TIGR03364 [Filimonas lacunae]|uniref:FAD dependent oxidoreductase TIGR03364 n=1 Tax=Filimonas lacunae TaxID=477680 RepID=A0A173MLW1_9BACT|nr:TIGR03364 family FAD-dependent oxidoreductase [Filimonas lacunae]BAV08614.1 secreted oxidoreductase [Filimonas lacunae]SIS58521.1 FAD dependent oxidoreductase TIGR03364 [Filimonas lacunae]